MTVKKMKHRAKSPSNKIELSDIHLSDAAKQKPGVIDVRIVPPREVETAEWMRLKCQFGCDGYGQCLVCPPFTPMPDMMRKVLDCYERGLLIHFEPESEIKATVAKLEREFFLAGAWKAFGLGAGPCYFCKRCDVKKGECKYADRARPAMEACGIDVFSTARKFGFPIEVVRTSRQCPNYYGLILVD